MVTSQLILIQEAQVCASKAISRNPASVCRTLQQSSKAELIPCIVHGCCPSDSVTKTQHGWIRKAQDKLIETMGSRTHLNLSGALPLEDIVATVTETYDTINTESIVHFFWKLKKGYYPLEQKVHLVFMKQPITESAKDAAKYSR